MVFHMIQAFGFIYLTTLILVEGLGFFISILFHQFKNFIYLFLMFFIYTLIICILIFAIPFLIPSMMIVTLRLFQVSNNALWVLVNEFKMKKLKEYLHVFDKQHKLPQKKRSVRFKIKLLGYLIQNIESQRREPIVLVDNSQKEANNDPQIYAAQLSIKEAMSAYTSFLSRIKNIKNSIKKSLNL